jgi:hypothetical protein
MGDDSHGLPPEKCFDAGVGGGIVMREDRRFPFEARLGKSSPELFMQWRGHLIRGLGSVGSRSIGPGTLVAGLFRETRGGSGAGRKPRPQEARYGKCNQYLGVL